MSTVAFDLSPSDRLGAIILGIAWAGTFYACAMIACTIALIDRWRGPHGKRRTGCCSVLGAFIMSIFWPVVFLYLCATGR